MNKDNSKSVSLRRWAVILSAVLLLAFCGFYFSSTSAKTDDVKRPVEQNLLNARLAYSRTTVPGGDRTIHTANSDGTGVVTVAGNYSMQPAWSPDGTKIAFVGTISLNEIFVVNAGGGGQTNLTNSAASERRPSWSAAGKIAYERDNLIWTMNENGSGQAPFSAITQPLPGAPAWSPDATKLAFGSGGDIWVINADGTGERRVTMNTSTDIDPSWSPDGSKIVFGKGGSGISVINLDGTGETPITTASTDGQPAWSPDGTKIAFRRPGVQGGGIFTMDVTGANQVRIVANTTSFPLCCDTLYDTPAWQPVAQTPNTYSISGYIRYNNLPLSGVTVDLRGTSNATTTTDAIGYYQFSGLAPGGNYTVSPGAVRSYFSPTNRSFSNLSSNQTGHNFTVLGVCVGGRCVRNGKIAYMSGFEIYTISPDGTGQTNITNNPAVDGEPNWSPDGVRLAFSSDRSGTGYEIYRMNSEDDTNPTRLTFNSFSDFSPSYSPDGSSLVFISDRDGGGFEVYKMNADGSNQVRLTNDTIHQGAPAFSPDGQKIVYVQGNVGSASLFIMNADGSNKRQLSPPGGFSPDYERPSYSPDGSKVIFTYTPDSQTQLRQTYTLNSDGTNRVPFPAGGRMGSYSPDGMSVVYHCCQFDNTNRLRTSDAAGSAGSVRSFSASAAPVDVADWQPLRVPRATFDFDGDGRSDISYFRPAGGFWYGLRSTAGPWAPQWGLATDLLAPGDYDGDLKTDLAVWRESDGNFYVLNSFNGTVRIENFGLPGDVPTGSDFDGDGKTDVALYRPGVQGVFYYRASMGNPQNNISSIAWGTTGDKPVPGDYDGDGRTDAAIYRPSNQFWYLRRSTDGQVATVQFGLANDNLVPADYDADGKTDVAVFRSGVWYLLRSAQGFIAFQFGLANDIPAPADYDGDGRADATIYRDGVWWILKSQSGSAEAIPFGTGTDKPIPATYVR